MNNILTFSIKYSNIEIAKSITIAMGGTKVPVKLLWEVTS